MKHAILILALLTSAAYANKAPHDCEPRTKPEPPAVSKPEPRAPQSRSDTVDRPCDRGEQAPVWCRVLK